MEVGNAARDYGYDLASIDSDYNLDEEWAMGSSSSISSGSLSPVDDHYTWEGDTLTSNSDLESGR